MVKLGEFNIDTILNDIHKNVPDGLPIEDDNAFEEILNVDWWAEASEARLFRLSQETSQTADDWTEYIYQSFLSCLANLSAGFNLLTNLAHVNTKHSMTIVTALMKRHLTYEYFLGEPLIPAGGVLMLLLMVYNKRSKNMALLMLVGAFLLQANPLYILLLYGVYYLRVALGMTYVLATKWFQSSSPTIDMEQHKKIHKKNLLNSPGVESDILAYEPESLEEYLKNSNIPSNNNLSSTTVDVILLGNDFGTLYTAGLLSQAGYKCLVLEPINSQPVRVVAQSSELPTVYLENMAVGDPVRTQQLLDNILCVEGSQEKQRILLTPLGSVAEDFAHTVIKLKHNTRQRSRPDEVLVLRPPGQQTILENVFEAGGSALPSNIAQRLEAEKSNQIPSPFSAICRFFNYLQQYAYPLLSPYLMLKVTKKVSHGANNNSEKKHTNIFILFLQSLLGVNTAHSGVQISRTDMQDIQNLGTLSVTGLLSQTLKSSEPSSKCIQKCFTHLASIGATVGANEFLSPNLLSSINIPYAMGQTNEGLFSPEGGCDAVFKRLIAVIRQAGGSVVHNVDIHSLIFADDAPDHTGSVIGVRINVDSGPSSAATASATPPLQVLGTHGIVSGLGALHTYQILGRRLAQVSTAGQATNERQGDPNEHVDEAKPRHNMPRCLLNACEARPKMHCVFWIKTASSQLNDMHPFNYFEFPSYPPPKTPAHSPSNGNSDGGGGPVQVPPGYLTSASGGVDMDTSGVVVQEYVKVWSPSAQDAKWKTSEHPDTQVVIVELEAGDAIIQKHIIPVHTTLPAGNTPTAPAAPAAPAVGRPETGTKAKVTGAYACFLPTGGSTTTTSTTTETSHLPVGGKEIQLSDAQRVHVLDHARGKLFSLYPQLQPVSSTAATATQRERSQRVLEEQVVVGYAGGRKLSANCHKFSINPHVQINAVCEGFENIFLCGQDVGFGGGLAGHMQGGWVAANSVLGFTQEDLFSGNNIITALRGSEQ